MREYDVSLPPEDLPEEREELRKERREAMKNIHAAGKILMEIRRGAEVRERNEEGVEAKDGKVWISEDLLKGKNPEEAVEELLERWKERYRKLIGKGK